jgi:hypothetical protein
MCNVRKHPLFDAHLHEVMAEHPESRADEIVKAFKWALEEGAEFEEEEYDATEYVYFVTLEGIQIFYDKRNPVGKPTEITLRTVVVRPD